MTAWEQYSEKFDALTQREKVMALVAGLAVIVMVGFTYGVEPLIKSNGKLRTEIVTMEVQSRSLVLQKQAYEEALAVDPDQEYKAKLEQLKKRMQAMDATFGHASAHGQYVIFVRTFDA